MTDALWCLIFFHYFASKGEDGAHYSLIPLFMEVAWRRGGCEGKDVLGKDVGEDILGTA